MRSSPCAILVMLVLSAATAVLAAPEKINYQGYLTDDQGVALNGDFTIEFKIYTAPTGGSLLWSETHNPIPVTQGIFHAILGRFTPIGSSLFEGDRWLEIRVRPDAPFPRQQFLSTPYAMRAAVADVALSGAPDDDWTISGENVYRLNGNVGIGTSTPAKKLHIETTDLGIDASDLTNEDIVVEAADAIVGLYSNTGGSYGSGFSLGEVSQGSVANRWDLTRRTTAGGGALETRYFDGTTTAELMRVQPDGKVGIGTSSPANELSVNGAIDAQTLIASRTLGLGEDGVPGVVYADNQIAAWGLIRMTDQSILLNRGIRSVSFGSPGFCQIGLTGWLFDGEFVPMVIPSQTTGEPFIATIFSRSQNSFTVQLRQWNGTAWVSANGTFYFMVVGRE